MPFQVSIIRFMRFTTAVLAAVSLIFCSSCEVDFSPNGKWRETPVIYALFDQDADTSFIRIEKCFLGQGNMLHFAKEKDSLYYSPADLQVEIQSLTSPDAKTPVAVSPCSYTTRSGHSDGMFYNGERPVYYFLSKDKLTTDLYYRLSVKNIKTGHESNANITMIKDYKLLYPSRELFRFDEGRRDNRKVTLKWNVQNSTQGSGSMAKLFQPVLRLYYLEDSTGNEDWVRRSVDISMPAQRRESLSDQTYALTEKSFLSVLTAKLKQNPKRKIFLEEGEIQMEIFIYGCDQYLTTFMDINRPAEGLSYERPLFSNVNNGIGIVAARRLHIGKPFYYIDAELAGKIRGLQIGF